MPAVGAPRAAVLALAAGGLAVAGFTLHVAAGAPLTPDAARTLSVALPLIAVGLVVARYQPQNRLGTILLIAGLLFSLTLTSVGILRWADDGARVPVLVQRSAFAFVLLSAWPLTTASVLALGGFPDGTLPSGRWRRWVLVTTGIHGVIAFGSYLTAGSSDLPRYLIGLRVPTGAPLTSTLIHDVLAAGNNILLFLLPAWALAGVVSRIRRASPVLRQQVKWLIPALGMQLIVHVAFPTSPDPWHGLRGVGEALVLLSPTVGTVATALAIFRYRLWDIDAVISKGLVFGLLWAMLSAAFFAVAYGAALLVGGSDARVLSALAVVLVATFASQGLRRRAESFVRRLVYGDRPGGYAVLAGLAESLRSAGTSEEVGQRILDAVRRGLSVPWATLWLHVESETGGTLQPLATTGAAMATSAPLTSTEADALAQKPASLTSDPAGPLAAPPRGTSLAAFAPLVAKDHLIGVIGCGDRAGDPLMESDLELLGLVAREAALALANQRLEAELRLRLQELERQADQLRRSRHRLVTAHDDERRRIERDLHDGVQAQLVALTVKLRRQASRSEGLDR